MKFIPKLFSIPMVQAILDGRKTQTRRIIKPQPLFKTARNFIMPNDSPKKFHDSDDFYSLLPYGQVGDILWVRETWKEAPEQCTWKKYTYKADFNPYLSELTKWKPNIFMPKSACRIFLKVKSIRVEKLQDITEADSIAEGIEMVKSSIINPAWGNYNRDDIEDAPYFSNPINSFESLWQSIYGEQSWNDNPWVYATEFERIDLTSEERELFLKK